jgi:putative DNA primase/helicase
MSDLNAVLSRLQGVQCHGDYHTAKCPAHDDGHSSLSISTGEDGKILLKCHAGCEFPAIIEAAGISTKDLFPDTPKSQRKKQSSRLGPVIAEYPYRDESGTLQYQALRHDPKDFSQRRPDGQGHWVYGLSEKKYWRNRAGDWYAVTKKTPPDAVRRDFPGYTPLIFRLPEIIAAVQSKKTVFIVEGEKDVLTAVSIGMEATCNSGGADKSKCKFPRHMIRHFQGARVVIIPDNDEPGIAHAHAVAGMLHGTAAGIRIVTLPGAKDLTAWIEAGHTLADLKPLVSGAPLWTPAAEPEIPPRDDPPGDAEEIPQNYADTFANAPFRCIGFNNGKYFYIANETEQITALAGKDHQKISLLMLAPLTWWENHFNPLKRTTGPDWTMAADALFRQSAKRGIFSKNILRGYGTWVDDGRVVIHRGNHLLIDGQQYDLSSFKTKYIYEATYSENGHTYDPLPNTEAVKFLNIMQSLNWKKPIDGLLLAGWCVVAPICGSLSWRPNAWICGASGSGKTYAVEQIILPILAGTALHVESESSAAGIRQALRLDARPVVFDEAEAEEDRSRARIKDILGLIRQATSRTGGKIAKGTQDGSGMQFLTHAMFLLSSINTHTFQKADARRIAIFELLKFKTSPDAEDPFLSISSSVRETIQKNDYCGRLLFRSYGLIHTIRTNSGVFTEAVANKLNDRTLGDLYGPMVAGAYSLTSQNIVTPDKAKEWVDKQKWDEQTPVSAETDERRCINRILQTVVIANGKAQKVERTIGRLLQIIAARIPLQEQDEVSDKEAGDILNRLGMRIIDNCFVISNSHEGLRKLMEKSPWAGNWSEQLRRIDGAEEASLVRFADYCRTRAVKIPLAFIFGDE